MLDWKPPHAKWFVGGKLNVSVNCLDRHVRGAAPQQGRDHLGRRARRSPHADLLRSLPPGLASSPTSSSRSASRRATASRSTCRSSPSSRSRCSPARASAPSTPSCSAASAPSRCAIASTTRSATLLVTADGGYRRGQIVPLKQMADEALDGTPSIEHVVVVQRAARRADAGAR